MSRREKIEKREQIALNVECSIVVSRKVPSKIKDPGSFTIPIEIGRVNFGKALCDLGASINLMRLSIYLRAKGVFEDMLVRVRQFILLINFIVVDFEEVIQVLRPISSPWML
ncbi:gag-asp_proteas domain-containing protein [Gossypium australe]|uniref:Gag-asp_proteas domain-containing protein n=1 Tax=Gossypium australe TaxID=47621 RepID=A0A5B6VNP0_9ROSI|nr:gag-asp_proteas domain-containing protein [Gossypium australe]